MNTHNYTDFGDMDQTARMRKISTTQKRLTAKYRCCMVATAEYRKNMPGDESRLKLPVNDDLADARAMIYRPNMIIHVYNDLNDRGEYAETFWIGADKERKPRLLLLFNKNKITGFKSPEHKLILDLDPETVAVSQKRTSDARKEVERFIDDKESGRVRTEGNHLIYVEAD